MTNDGPRINHYDFVVHQKNTVVAIVASDRLDDCAAALAAAGVDLSQVNVLQGQAGADILDFDGTEHGPWAHAVRTLQKLGTYAEADACARVLYEHGGRRILHFGKHATEQLSF